MTEHVPEPLPREWLPAPLGPAGADAAPWEARLQRLAAAAGPALARLRARPLPWWSVLAARWKPLAGAAAATAAGLTLVLYLTASPAPRPAAGAPTISAVVSGGEPAALWAALGAQADPALALIALNGDRP